MEKCWALSVWRIASTQTFRTSWYCVFDNVEKMLPQQTGQVSQAQISDWPEFSVFESHKPRYISLGLPAQTFWSNAYFPMVICPWRQIAGDVTGLFPRVTNWFGDRASCTFTFWTKSFGGVSPICPIGRKRAKDFRLQMSVQCLLATLYRSASSCDVSTRNPLFRPSSWAASCCMKCLHPNASQF